jgi:hypothetical protein
MSDNNYHNGPDKFIDDSGYIHKKFSEIHDKVDCLQRAIAMVCGQQSDFRAEYAEDITEIKRQLHELRRNKVWLAQERL